MGPSLVDEVFGELGAGVGLDLDDRRRDTKKAPEESKKSSDLKDLKDLVSSLTITRFAFIFFVNYLLINFDKKNSICFQETETKESSDSETHQSLGQKDFRKCHSYG